MTTRLEIIKEYVKKAGRPVPVKVATYCDGTFDVYKHPDLGEFLCLDYKDKNGDEHRFVSGMFIGIPEVNQLSFFLDAFEPQEAFVIKTKTVETVWTFQHLYICFIDRDGFESIHDDLVKARKDEFDIFYNNKLS